MSTPSYEEIRRQVERRYRRRALFIYHLIIACAGIPALWFVAGRNGIVSLVITVLWVGLLLLHGVRLLMEGAKDREIERTWRRYYGDIGYEDVKPKRSFRLSDDAELEVIEDDDYAKPKRLTR